MEGVAVAGMRHKRGATWAEAKTGARGLRAGFSILRDLGETPYPGSKNQLSRAPQVLLTLILWGVSRSRFRETVGASSQECRGLIDLMAAEAAPKPALGNAVNALLALRPDDKTPISVPSA
jgi:2-dehydropantoate 2-reductase